MKPVITAVITLYNKQDYIERSLLSVLKQGDEVYEIIVVDDGSQDGGAEIVKSYQEVYNKIRYIRQKNQGVSVARNQGAKEASGDVICFLDADDEWLPCFATEMGYLIEQCPEASVFSLRHDWVNSNGSHVRQRVALPKGYSGVVENFIDVYRRGYGIIHSSCVGIRKSTFFKHGGFPPGAKKSQDVYLWLVLGMNEKVAFRDATAALRHEAGSGVSLRNDYVSHHIVKFMNDSELPNYKTDEKLARFLRKSIFVMMLENKLTNNTSTSSELLAYARKFGIPFFLFLAVFFTLPAPFVRHMRLLQQKLKNYK